MRFFMQDNQNNIKELLAKLESLVSKQDEFSKEIDSLRSEIDKLASPEILGDVDNLETALGETQVDDLMDTISETPEQIPEPQTSSPKPPTEEIPIQKPSAPKPITPKPPTPKHRRSPKPPTPKPRTPRKTPHLDKLRSKLGSNIERYIGENLIAFIGIIVLVIGVSIGVKYSIEHALISPLTRVILGYLVGAVLLALGIKLKKNYDSFSSVLVSGAIVILYFITFSAYSFYDLIPQAMAFLLMVVFTTFTIIAALNYNKQVIALIGLVGAYAVPLLLGVIEDDSTVLFAYMVIINIGILVLAFKKYWKVLYYSSFALTWLTYGIWYFSNYSRAGHVLMIPSFILLFFLTFYTTFLAYKLLRQEKFVYSDISLLLMNSFIFYGFGFAIIEDMNLGKELMGLFTLANAFVHFAVSIIIYKQKLADKNLFYLVSGLVLVFVAIAIPIQLDGNWVTLMWLGQALLLFIIGRTRKIGFYEKMSYPLMFIAFMSIIQDWSSYNLYYPTNPDLRIPLLININFLTSLLFVGAFGVLAYVNRIKKFRTGLVSQSSFFGFVSYIIPSILLISLYFSMRLEIATFWTQLYNDSTFIDSYSQMQGSGFFRGRDLMDFKALWVINYSLLFASLLTWVNIKKFKSKALAVFNYAFNALTITVFLVQSLDLLSHLRHIYIAERGSGFQLGLMYIGIRYASLAFVVLALAMSYLYVRQDFFRKRMKMVYNIFLHTSLLWIFSSELIHWLHIYGSDQSYKLGLSILWGVYALVLISIGIWKNRRLFRIEAIILFAITLIKLFFYDISHLDTIDKTVVFVSLGILLLIISFLYNKNKAIFIENTDE